MQIFAIVWSVSFLLTLGFSPQRETPRRTTGNTETAQRTLAENAQRSPTENAQRSPALRQLAAVRGEIIKVTRPSKGMLLITVRPAKEFQEVTVLARENDLVGAAVGRSGESDLLGLLSDDTRDDETITAAELNEGDVVSVIYDPARQNRVLEIYVR
jgi:DNA-directed RNA polymerase subunit H (RpoH/RPB5)